jgi:hypothetical protein
MTPLQLATLAIRLVALVWAVVTISNTHQWIPYLADAELGNVAARFAFMTALQVSICAVLFIFPATIATMLLPSLKSARTPEPAHSLEWQTVGVICVGLWVLTRAIPSAFYWATYYFVARGAGLDEFASDPQHIAGIATIAVEMALGLWLTIGGKGIAAALLRIRSAGLRQ